MNTDNKMKELKDAAHAAESTYNVAHDVARAAYAAHDSRASIASHAVCATYKAVCDADKAASDAWDAYIAYIETTTAD